MCIYQYGQPLQVPDRRDVHAMQLLYDSHFLSWFDLRIRFLFVVTFFCSVEMKHLVWGKSLAALQKALAGKKTTKNTLVFPFCTTKEVPAWKMPCKIKTLLSGVKSFLKFPRQALISGTGEVPREGMRQVTGTQGWTQEWRLRDFPI